MSADAPDRDAQAPDRLVELGRIVSAYGIKGWIKVQPHSAQAEVLRSVKQWWLAKPGIVASVPSSDGAARGVASVDVLAARPQGSAVVAQIQGIDDRTQAEGLRGMAVYVPRSIFPLPEDGEYYWVDLVGCLLHGEQDGRSVLLGRVTDVTDNGVHAILKVDKLAPSPDGGDPVPVLDPKGRPVELLVPFVDAHLRAVDLAARRIDTDWPADF